MMVSCTPDEECRQEENVRCKVVFALDDGTAVAFDSLSVWGIGSDSVLYNNAKNVSSLSLPLRPDANITQFYIMIGDWSDGLTIYHTPTPYFVSMACGCFVYHTIDSVEVKGTIFHHAELLNAAVQNVEQENIRLIIDN